MNIPSVPGWESFPVELNGEPRFFLTSFFIPDGNGQEIEYGGRIVARSFEEARQIAASTPIPRTVVLGVLGGVIQPHIMN